MAETYNANQGPSHRVLPDNFSNDDIMVEIEEAVSNIIARRKDGLWDYVDADKLDGNQSENEGEDAEDEGEDAEDEAEGIEDMAEDRNDIDDRERIVEYVAEQATRAKDSLVEILDSTRKAVDNAQVQIEKLDRSLIFFHLKDRTVKLKPSEVLQFFWNNCADTPCVVCKEQFAENRSPPIRTVSIEATFQHLTHVHFRVYNRHAQCLQRENVKYLTVSHAWHEEIAIANGSGNSTSMASIRVVETLCKIIFATVETIIPDLGSRVEVWHDYFSVPQWNQAIKGSLLLLIPTIYAASWACLVHLDEFPFSNVQSLLLNKANDEEISKILGSFYGCRWFKRMWVVLEYISCEKAHLLTSDFRIFYIDWIEEVRNQKGTFHELWSFIRTKEHLLRFSEGLNGVTSRFKVQTYRRRRPASLTYAEAFSIIAGKQCSVHRDRFLAICGFLDIGSHIDLALKIPKEADAACLFVAWKCLESGDYTPLLLVPGFSSFEEPEVAGHSWLIGHQKIFGLPGNELGSQTSAPHDPVIIRNNAVRPRLEHVGSIEQMRNFGFYGMDPIEQLLNIVDCILAWHGCRATGFLPAIRRVFHFTSDSNPGEAHLEEDVAPLLKNLKSSTNQSQEDRLQQVSKLAELLDISLDNARRHNDGWLAGNTLCLVRCRGCNTLSTIQLYLFRGRSPETQVQIYRIPGLGFEKSYPNGVGVLLSGKKIVGRMLYGTPSCSCKSMDLMDFVEIE